MSDEKEEACFDGIASGIFQTIEKLAAVAAVICFQNITTEASAIHFPTLSQTTTPPLSPLDEVPANIT